MVNPLRTRKRVRALPRAADGSAFQKCECCGILVPVALADMHECETKKEVKRFRGFCERPDAGKQNSVDHLVRSPFRFFMESFVKTCKSEKLIEIDRKGFEAWKNMSKEEKQPFLIQAERVNAACQRVLFEEVNNMLEVDDEADSAMVGIFDKFYEEDYRDSDSLGFQSLNTYEWAMVQSWIVESSE